MKTLIIMLMFIFPSVALAQSGSYTITTTPIRDQALQWKLDEVNARRGAHLPPQTALTKNQYLQVRNDRLLRGIVQYFKKGQMDVLRSTLTQTQIDNLVECGSLTSCP